jgi:predicted lysophospholipase L1 biosynthesis ABC-type transport system permease subunit
MRNQNIAAQIAYDYKGICDYVICCTQEYIEKGPRIYLQSFLINNNWTGIFSKIAAYFPVVSYRLDVRKLKMNERALLSQLTNCVDRQGRLSGYHSDNLDG